MAEIRTYRCAGRILISGGKILHAQREPHDSPMAGTPEFRRLEEKMGDATHIGYQISALREKGGRGLFHLTIRYLFNPSGDARKMLGDLVDAISLLGGRHSRLGPMTRIWIKRTWLINPKNFHLYRNRVRKLGWLLEPVLKRKALDYSKRLQHGASRLPDRYARLTSFLTLPGSNDYLELWLKNHKEAIPSMEKLKASLEKGNPDALSHRNSAILALLNKRLRPEIASRLFREAYGSYSMERVH